MDRATGFPVIFTKGDNLYDSVCFPFPKQSSQKKELASKKQILTASSKKQILTYNCLDWKPELLIRGDIEDNSKKLFSYFSVKTYVVTPQ